MLTMLIAPTSRHPILLLALALFAFGPITTVYAQDVTVRGTVVDDKTGDPLPGANVLVENTEIGTTTNLEGAFTLNVPGPNSTLIVSYVGFLSQDLPLNGRTDVVIRLREDVALLDEVVVVGYGTQRRADVTGSVSSVSPSRLEEVPNTSFVQALQGAVPGVSIRQTGAGAEPNNLDILVRGQNSITASNRPLVVVDGIPYEGSLSEINQNDVASIEVLKDASAAAIYGARGSNGVVLVSTKKGVVGRPQVRYEGYVGTQRIANVPRLMAGPEFAAFKCERLNNGVACAPEDITAGLTASEAAVYEAGQWTDWVDLATRRGVQQQHNLSFSGGTTDTRYYISGSLLDVQGVASNDAFERYTLRVNLDQTLNSWLRTGTNTQLAYSDRSGLQASFGDAFTMNPLTRAYEDDGSLTIKPWPDDPFFDNPLEGINAVDSDVNRRVVSSNFAAIDLPFVEGLTYRLNAGLDFANTKAGRYYGRNTGRGISVLGEARTETAVRFDWTLENIVRYEQDFGRHHVDLTGLYGAQKSSLEEDVLRSQGFPNDVLTYYQANVAALVEPSYEVEEEKLVSQMGRVNYAYDSRYLLTITARRDGSSVFGANNKYGVFPSIAVGWNLAREAFWPLAGTVNTLKLRTSYGKNGNSAVSPYRTLARLREESYLDGTATAPGFVPSTLGNPNLQWETTTAFNFGVDFGLFRDRVVGTLDAYVSNTNDLLLNRAISSVHGIDQITENIGQTRNRGLELQLRTVNVNTDNFTWSSNFNVAGNRNEIVSLYGTLDDAGQEIDDVANKWFIGRPIDVNYSLAFGGIWQVGEEEEAAKYGAVPGDVRIIDLDNDGDIDAADRTFIGNLEPDFTAGLINTLRYKQFSLDFFFQTVQGIRRSNVLLGSNQVHADVRLNTLNNEYWSPENPIDFYPANRDTSNPRGVGFYEDASFIRLKDVTLSYDLPSRFSDRLGFGSLRVYVNGRNLWTITDWSGLDPELDRQRAIPLEKVFIVGVNLSL